MDIVLNKPTGGLDLDFTDLSNTTSIPEINVNKSTNGFNEVVNISSSKPNLTMSSRKVSIGLDLLANPNKVRADTGPSFGTGYSSSKTVVLDKINEIKIDNASLGLGLNSNSNNGGIKEISFNDIPKSSVTAGLGPEIKLDGDLSSSGQNNVNSFDFSSLPTKKESIKLTPAEEDQARRKKYEDIQKEKFELLCLFERLEKKGIHTIKKFSMNSDIDEMRYEYNRIKKQRDIESSVKFQRKMLMACITGVEFLNNKFDPFDIKLDGWSESIHENLNDYDDVFEELYEKYNTKTNIAPELKLMFMVGGSAFMFHLTNTMFKSSLPGMGDIMKQNPELMQQFAKAAMSSMNSNSQSSADVSDILNRDRDSAPQRDMQGPPNIEDILNQISTENGGGRSGGGRSGGDGSDGDGSGDNDGLKTINLGGSGRGSGRSRGSSNITLNL